MKPLFATAALLLATCAAARAECPVSGIEKALVSSLDGLKVTEKSVSAVQSTEGGVWRIYQHTDGTLEAIIRLDGGESGMGELRLGIVNDNAYGIAKTRVDYLRHAFIDEAGPNGTARRSTDYFYYCDGKLLMPPEAYATLDTGEYARAGADAQKAMLLDKDIATLTRRLSR